ncbi:MAG: glutathione S-transferase family protein [Betaproteobacteria bacterium]|nr:glutathione S-transferase family protein [Betaproteobacteria bacterium]
MKLIGMLDSPYVRRVAISLKLMGIAFEHQSVSVFRDFERFRELNPVVKAPTLICDDGVALMDSTLILDYLEGLVPPEKRLMPLAGDARREALRLTGFALAACDKCVSLVYEHEQRPTDKRHEPWHERVLGQALSAFTVLEDAVGRADPWLQGAGPNAADIATAVAWRFGQYYNADLVPAWKYPSLVRFSAQLEALPAFESTPLD